jgi:integrase/recombinase XerD
VTATVPAAVAPALDALRAAFLESLRVRRYAPATLATRAQSLAVFFAFLAERHVADVREVTREHVRGFAAWLAAKSYTDHTRCAHLAALRAFFAHPERTDAILVNPCADLVLPRIHKRLPRGVLTREEARRVLDAPDVQTRTGLRDKAILEVFYSTGLRLAELARLTVFDLDHRNGFVRVNRGKGGKDRIVPIGAKACGFVREYLAQARLEWSKANPDERALWLSGKRPHGPLKPQMIEVMVKHCGRAAGVRVTPHVWRHTCATHLVANGANLAAVQRQLGHKSLRTTQLYTRVAVPDLVAMHAKAHPRSRSARRTKPAAP